MKTESQSAHEILKELVEIHSVSSVSNAPVLATAEKFLRHVGWTTLRLPYGKDDMANLLAIPPQFADALPHVDLAFVCHTDTVPHHTGWGNALNVTEDNGNLHGCGTCDVKGSLAGLLTAALETPLREITQSVAYVFTAQEEIGCVGANQLVEHTAILPKATVICEPTSLRPALAGKGYGLAQVMIRGAEAHSAFPAKGVSAIHAAARFISQIDSATRAGAPQEDALFTPPVTTWNVGKIEGGTAKNILAGACTFLVEWRPLPGDDPARMGAGLQKIARRVETEFPGCSVKVDVQRAEPGFKNSVSSAFATGLLDVFKREATGISFGSEATRMLRLCDEVAVIGPGDMETAHSERECVPLAELNEWTDAVKRLLKR